MGIICGNTGNWQEIECINCDCIESSTSKISYSRQAGRMNKKAYEKCIAEDIEVLHQLPQSIERDHIERVLKHSIVVYYGE